MRELIRSRLRDSLLQATPPELMGRPLGDGHALAAIESFRPAAVLVPIIDHPEGMTVLLTRRPDTMNSHAGQVAFPGGRIDPEDASPMACALREAEEEVGLQPHHVEIVGKLDDYHTGTGFQIIPIVGLITPGFQVVANHHEVAEVFEVPLEFLMNPDNHQRHEGVWNGKKSQYYAMPYKEHYIWGATAGMLVNLFNRLYS